SDESNVNLEEEIFDNNLEPEISTTLYRNRQGRDSSNSCGNCSNCGNHDNSNSCGGHSDHRGHGTGDSIGCYSSSYSNPCPIPDYSSNAIENSVINNCWNKTEILLLVFYEEIKLATCTQDAVLEQQEQNISMLVVDLTSQDPNLEIEDQLNTYLDLNNLYIITEKNLNNSKIIKV
ncbi:1011_t:CDS:2, partial [Cetraspora pellucida]